MKKEYLVLTLVIVSLSLYLLFRQSGYNLRDIPELEPVDKGAITKITVKGMENSYTLVNKNKVWTLEKGNFKADEVKADKVASLIAELKLREMVSESENYDRYELGSNKALNVKAFAGDKPVREFVVGKAASTYRHTYVKLSKDHKVYLASGAFRKDFDMAAKEMRDKKVMDFKKDAVTSIAFKEKDSMLSFSKIEEKSPAAKDGQKQAAQETKVVSWQFSIGRKGDKKAIEEVIGELSNLKCDSYVPQKPKADLMNPVYTVTVMTDKTHTINFYGQNGDNANEFLISSSDSDTPFLLASWKAKKIMKAFDELKGMKKDKK